VTPDFGSVLGGVEVTNPWATEDDARDPGASMTYDFENVNPWSRVYPQPVKSEAGEGVVGTSELSDEQAHSGKRSAKLHVVFPPSQRNRWLIKLFSLKMDYTKPVRVLRFWLCADGTGTGCVPRIRDRSGECFYGPAVSLDWTGWRQIEWDLNETPPVSIANGDGNRTQDIPPVELVLELTPKMEADGSEFTIFLDDLEVGFQ